MAAISKIATKTLYKVDNWYGIIIIVYSLLVLITVYIHKLPYSVHQMSCFYHDWSIIAHQFICKLAGYRMFGGHAGNGSHLTCCLQFPIICDSTYNKVYHMSCFYQKVNNFELNGCTSPLS